MMPVPAGAGLISDFLASSVALRMASGTSRALPWPKPTRPFWSPTTTSAAKPKRLPPFTTLATRLMCTSLSMNSLSRSRSSRSRLSPPLPPLRSAMTFGPLEIQSCLAGSIGERLHAPMVEIAAAVEHDVGDARFQRPLGDELTHGLRRFEVAALLEGALEILVQGRSRDHG